MTRLSGIELAGIDRDAWMRSRRIATHVQIEGIRRTLKPRFGIRHMERHLATLEAVDRDARASGLALARPVPPVLPLPEPIPRPTRIRSLFAPSDCRE